MYNTACALNTACNFGVWLSLVERHVRDVEVEGSNPFTPTMKNDKFRQKLVVFQ